MHARINWKGVYEYLIKWKGFAAKDNTWELASNLELQDPVFETFHVAQPEIPRPTL